MTARDRSTSDTPGEIPRDVAGALATLVRYIRATVRAEVRAARDGNDPDPWVDHRSWPCASRRAACALARSGALQGVARVGSGRGALYVVRRSELDRWIDSHRLDGAAEQHEPAPDDGYERARARSRARAARKRIA